MGERQERGGEWEGWGREMKSRKDSEGVGGNRDERGGEWVGWEGKERRGRGMGGAGG